MSIRYRLAAVLATLVLPLLLVVSAVVGVALPNRLATAQGHGLEIAAQSIGSSMAYECGALGYRTQVIALDVANGRPPAQVLAAQKGGRRDADSYDVVQVGTAVPVTRGDLAGADPRRLPARRCSDTPAPVDHAVNGTPVLVEQATVSTSAGPIVVTSVERITPQWVQAAKEQALIPTTHVTLYCPTGSTAESSREADVVWRESPAAVGRPCDVRAGDTRIAGQRYREWTAIVGLVVLGLTLLLSVWLADELTGPIRALSSMARRATAGDRQVRSGTRRRDEIGDLGRDLDAMVAELDGLIVQAHQDRDALRDTSRRLGDILQRTHDLDGMLTALAALAETTGAATCASVWMTEGSGLRLRTVHPVGSVRPDARTVQGDELPARAAATRRTVVRDDVSGDPSSMVGGRMVALPLVSGEEVIGVLAVERTADAPPFDADAVERLELAMGSAGIAVDNAMLHRAVQRQSVVDPLTGVGNMRHLVATLSREVDRGTRFGRPVAVLVVDIDEFARLNAELGPSVGDGVLTALAVRLREHVRSVDTVARYGGEEFAVVCPELGPENALRAAERLVEAVRGTTLTVLGIPVRLTVSVGVACYPANGTSAQLLLAAADAAMGSAKQLGRDRAVMAPPG